MICHALGSSRRVTNAVAQSASREERIRFAVSVWAQARRPNTVKAYESDLRMFAAFAGLNDAFGVLVWICEASADDVRSVSDAWAASLIREGLSTATINRRVSALRTMANVLRKRGLTTATVDPDIPPIGDPVRPMLLTLDHLRELTCVIQSQPDPVLAKRDMLIFQLLYGLALRRSEAHGIEVRDVDNAASSLIVTRKGGHRERITMPSAVRAAMQDWLDVRDADSGEKLLNAYGSGGRCVRPMSMNGISARMKFHASKVPLHPGSPDDGRTLKDVVACHQFRRAAITHALRLSGGDVTKVQRFSGHRSLDGVMRYDIDDQDFGAEIASALSDNLNAAS